MDAIFYLPVALSACLACFVEMVEALTIVLAVGVSCGWKSAWAGAVSAVFVLMLIVGIGGIGLRHANLHPLQVGIGVLLLLFGMRWLRKAVLRASGYIALHDEDAAFAKEIETLKSRRSEMRLGIDAAGAATAFQGVLIEGLEVVFIVIAVGTTTIRLESASIGAAIALVLVVALGLILHTPLSKIPENSLKFLVGVMLMSLGTVWTGEGIGLAWPLGDWSIVGMSVLYFMIAFAMVAVLKKPDIKAVQ
jgi:uncharacterized membrane protein